MTPARLISFLHTAIKHNHRVLVKGVPGGGKSDCVARAAQDCGAEVVLMHPSISDPTDFKGMPALAKDGNSAHFLPFGDLVKLCAAKKPTVAFLDDIGQSAPAVQAALMQLILARSVNGTKISPQVVFLGATNDTTHMAGVSGMIEPLKSRWDTIVQLDVSIEDWSDWALQNNMPVELIAFLRFRPELLSKFTPTKEIKNSPSPRGWASVGRWVENGVRDMDVFTGAVGEGAATEFYAFLDMHKDLPSLDAIMLNPDTTEVPEKPAGMYAVASGLARKANKTTLERIIRYLERMPKEFEVMCVRDSAKVTKNITDCDAFVKWSVKNKDVVL